MIMNFIINTDTSLIMTLNWEQLPLQITLEERSVWLYLPWNRSNIDLYKISFGIQILLKRDYYFFIITWSSPSWQPLISPSSSITLLQYLAYHYCTSSLTFLCTYLPQLQRVWRGRAVRKRDRALVAARSVFLGKKRFAILIQKVSLSLSTCPFQSCMHA